MESIVQRLLALDPKLRRVAARIAMDPEEAQDLVQDVWLAALTKFPGADCALEPWALQVLRNQFARRARRPRLASTGSDLDQFEDAAGTQQTLAERREVERHLRACIESLPEPYRSTLIERFYASRSVGDIAATRGVPRATVSTHLQRALQRLRARIGRTRDLLGAFPLLRWSNRASSAAKIYSPGSAVFARSLAFACIASPIVLAIAWARNPEARLVDTDLHATVSKPDAHAPAGEALENIASRIAVPLDAEPVGELLRVEVREAGSLQVLAGCALSVWSEDGSQFDRTTDGEGVCSLPAKLATQWLVVGIEPQSNDRSEDRANDAAIEPFRAFARAEAKELRIVYSRGPCVLANFHPPRGFHPAELVYGLRSVNPGSLTSPRLQVGPGSQPFSWQVQLPADWSRMTELSEMELQVVSPDGLLGSEARITPEALSLRQGLELEFEPRAALSISIRTSEYGPLRSGVIRLQPRDKQGAWLAEPGASARAWIPGMLPGVYSVEVIVLGSAPWTRELELVGGVLESLTADLIAQALPAAALIHGRIVRTRAGYDGAVIIALEGGRTPQFKRLVWVECAQGFEARFEFPDVDIARAMLRPIAIDGLPRFEPPVVESVGDGEAIEIRCHGERSAVAIACDVRSLEDEQPIAGFELEFSLPGRTEIFYRQSSSSTVQDPQWSVSSHGLRWKVRSGSPWDWFEPGSSARWTLIAPGFESVSGDERAWISGTFSQRLRPKPAGAGSNPQRQTSRR